MLLFYRTTLCYSAVYAIALCLSVCLSQLSRSYIKMAKRRFKQTTAHDAKDLREIQLGSITPTGTGGLRSANSDK